jgi:outer membrane protein OmpA-like peptidoglycan-associated protein
MILRHPILLLMLLSCVHLMAQDCEVKPLGCNSVYNDFAPTAYNNGVVFCSDRPMRFAVTYIDAAGNNPSKIHFSPNNGHSKSNLFDANLASKLNEGPACFSADGQMMVYTGTIHFGKKNIENKLGIFICNRNGNGWSEPDPFDFNAQDSSYSIAHPCLSQDGQYLYFSSDMENGLGGKDIYRSRKVPEGWSKPENLGPAINSEYNEVFPFIHSDGRLCFSSNRNDGANDIDIYLAYPSGESWIEAKKMEAPINSDADDFSIYLAENGESGYFASNRNGKDDDLFQFNYKYPVFEACPPSEKPTFCYLFEETNIIQNDTLPLLFEWEFGDGTKQKDKLSVEHCFPDFGHYEIALNVYDSVTRVQFARVSEIDLDIEKSDFPFIQSNDSILTNQELLISGLQSDIKNFTIDQYFWDFGDGTRAKGEEAKHIYDIPGIYTIQVGVFSKPTNGEIQKRCATKTIAVGTPLELVGVTEETPIQTEHRSIMHNDMIFVESNAKEILKHAPDSTVYFVEFKKSEVPIPLNDPYFENIKYEITERKSEKDTLYHYSVGETNKLDVMIRIYQDLVASGYEESLVKESISDDFNKQTVKQWWYIPDSLESAINKHLNKFSDIRFDYNDSRIKSESFENLEYIVYVMRKEPSLSLKIKAHTDSLGSSEHNLQLSVLRAEAVVYYLASRGLDADRLIPEGYGETLPVTDNTTEDGRAINRRVEFEILFTEQKKSKKNGRK